MKLLIQAIVLFLAGCNAFDLDDKKEAMSKFGADPIRRELETVIEGEKIELLPSEYLRKFAAIVAIDPDSKYPSPPNLHTELNQQRQITSLTIEWDGRATKFGSAAPISEDGYFLTANHVATKGYVWVIHFEETESHPDRGARRIKRSNQVAPARVVFSSKNADFAIIKANIDVQDFLEIREAPVERDELLFSGGWINASGAGHYKRSLLFSRNANYDGYWYRVMKTSIPAMEGDSGSPVVDALGRLCGITKNFAVSRFTGERFSVAVLLEPELIQRLIEEDRDANRAVATASVGTPH